MSLQTHTLYPNFVLANKLTDLLNTKLSARSYMTIDNSLVGVDGDIKKIHVYTYAGNIEEVGRGEGNTTAGTVSYTTEQYEVKTLQSRFDYADEDVRQDPMVLDAGLNGEAVGFVNKFNEQFFGELAKANLTHNIEGTFGYDDVVDAIQKMNIEDESGLFLIIGNDLKAEVRKDEEFKSARQGEILFNGQIGSICGVPVIVSKLAPANTAYLATKEAVSLFIKKESEVEQERDANTRVNSMFLRAVYVMALTDKTKVVKITKG